MNEAAAVGDKRRETKRVIPFDRVVLVLQGGGALGAYQAGVYEAIHAAQIEVIGFAARQSAASTAR